VLQIEVKNHLGQVIGSARVKDWEKRENTLVATVFGFAAYLPFDVILGPILKESSLIGNSQPFPTGVSDNDIDQAELWPSMNFQEGFTPPAKIGGGRSDELDALWRFKNFNLVIEAKKIGARFDPEQLYKYISAFTKRTSKPLWFLAVGKGLAAVKSLAGLKVGKDVNILYIDWQSILGVITKELAVNQLKEAHIRRCLKDIKTSLERRNLKPFIGFFCQEKALRLQSIRDIQVTVRQNWFPHNFSLWSAIPQDLLQIKTCFLSGTSGIYASEKT